MADRLPPDDGDDLFEWTDAPSGPGRPSEPEETGERERPGADLPERPGTGERERIEPSEPPSPPTGERPRIRGDTGERGRVRGDTGERARVRGDTGERARVRGDTGEYERSGRKPPSGRRSRHRDLPARVRRRQAFGIGAVALVVIVVLIVLVSGGGDDGGEEAVPVEELAGQTIVAQLGRGAPDPSLLARVSSGQVGGVIVEQRRPEAVRESVRALQRAAIDGGNPPLLVMIDQEGGPVKRLEAGPPDASPRQLGEAGDADAARDEGEKTGEFLSGLGVNVDLAPVLDTSQPQTADEIASRTFGEDPAVVAEVGVPFAEGLQDAGVAATAKHFPGLGRATQSTDDQPVTVPALSSDLEADLEPFREAVDAGVELVMVSSASYPQLGSKEQAAFSPAIVEGLLRDDLGFQGVVVTDDLQAPAVASAAKPGAAAVNALGAGNDLLLYAGNQRGSIKAFGAVVRAVNGGALDRARVEAAYERITALKDRLLAG